MKYAKIAIAKDKTVSHEGDEFTTTDSNKPVYVVMTGETTGDRQKRKAIF